MKSDFLIALTQLAAERHLPREQVLQAIEVALASAFKKDNPASGQNISVTLNPNTGEVQVFALRTVVESVEDSDREISLNDAQGIKAGADIGDEIAAAEPLPHNASRIAAQTAKQVVLQRLREAERELVYQEFVQHEDDIVSGVIEQTEQGRSIILELGRAQAILPFEEQVPTERYRKGQRTKVYVLSVRNGSKGPEIIVSRNHKNMLKRLFEIEVPEVYNGVVEIKAIAREAGFRSKVAVKATQQGIDPVGSCIGVRGNRIQSIVNELQGEKIDVISWDEDPKVFISKALSPSEVVAVELSTADQTAVVVVPDRQLSLAIGKEGQNTRLAARLTGWRLDIKGMTEWEEIREARRRKAVEKETLEPEAKESEELVAVDELALAEVGEAAQDEGLAETLGVAVAEASVDGAATQEAEVVDSAAPATEEVAGSLDEDEILAALIREEEAGREAVADEATVGFSVDDLESFTLDGVEVSDDDDEDEDMEDGEDGVLGDLPEVPVLIPDAGKIRFAEDIIEESRGGGRGAGRGRRGGGAKGRGGNRRGGR
ncbi:MAG: transcription termination/antitermination protein NusA [Chloroflexi bacterium]|nr:transcription termination/antitermination protein NusA [Chloroflexota bacterium]